MSLALEHLLKNLSASCLPSTLTFSHAATRVSARRAQKLLTYRQAAPDKPPAWAPTPMGRAVYDSGLATNIGMRLYDELSKAEAGLVLGEPLHLVYIIMPEHPFKIFGWSHWGRLFRSLTSAQKKARLCFLLAVFLVWILFGASSRGKGGAQFVVLLLLGRILRL